MKYLWFKLRLHTQIVTVSTVILAITIIVITGVNIKRDQANLRQNLLGNAMGLGQSLASTISYNIVDEQYDTIEEILIKLADYPDVESLRVADISGRIISSIKKLNNNEIYVSYADEKDTFPLTLKNNQKPSHFFNQDSLVIWYPLKTSNVIGWLNISMSLSEINFQRAEIVRNNIIGALIAIFIDILLLMFAISIPVRKLNKAIEVAEKLDRVNPQTSNETGGSFEINNLLTSLNNVANRLVIQKESITKSQQDSEVLSEEINKAYQNLAESNHKLEQLSRTDALTNIANRRCFDETLEAETRRQRRQGTPLTLMLCDIDSFKQYNDSYGHQAGDACLQKIAESINLSFSRAGDVVARYGGEEFAVILPNVDKTNALILAERMRENIVKLALEHKSSSIASIVTLSIGVTTLLPDKDTSIPIIIKNADEALYSAKAAGRNNVKYSS